MIEPTELGAQVRDRDGDVWTLVERNGKRGWMILVNNTCQREGLHLHVATPLLDLEAPQSWEDIQSWGPMEETS